MRRLTIPAVWLVAALVMSFGAVANASAEPPIVTKVAPKFGSAGGGTLVTITGTSFTGATEVHFGAHLGAIKTVESTSITATSPAGTGIVDVTVTTAGGESPKENRDLFSYAPEVNDVTPNQGEAGRPVVIKGTNFSEVTEVKFGEANATIKEITPTKIVTVAPAGEGVVHVTLTSPGGTSPTEPNDLFAYGAPEFGRCLKQATKSVNNYDSAKCTKLASEDAGTEEEKLKKGNYQWFSGVAKKNFTTKIKEGTIATLEAASGSKGTCTGETSTGEYNTSKKVSGVVVVFTGCNLFGSSCSSPGHATGTIVTSPLEGVLGVETETSGGPVNDHLAVEWGAPPGKNVSEFDCSGLNVTVRGSILHNLLTNTMKLTATEQFTMSGGNQKPDTFVGGAPGEHILEVSTNGSAFEPWGWSMTTILTNEESVEASAIH
jgi:IPT/TIG domain